MLGLEGGGVEVATEGEGHGVGRVGLAQQLGFEVGEVGVGGVGQGAVLGLRELGVGLNVGKHGIRRGLLVAVEDAGQAL